MWFHAFFTPLLHILLMLSLLLLMLSLPVCLVLSCNVQRLFAYISGGNVEGKKIDMTAPVRARVVPGPGPTCESYFTVSFFVPFDLQVSRRMAPSFMLASVNPQ